MREKRLSGSMSGNRKQSHAKPDCGGAAKAQPWATGRLQPLRLFSTPHGTVGFSFLMPSKNGKGHACNATCENHDVV